MSGLYDELAPLYHLAVSTEKLYSLMQQAGFQDVRRLDGVFFSRY